MSGEVAREPQASRAGLRARLRDLGRAYLQLLAAQGISALGTHVTAVAMPTVAVLALGAGPVEASILFVAAYLPGAIFAPLAGAVVDRLPLRTVLIASDVIRALAVATVPVAGWAGRLSIPWLIAVASVISIATPPFDTAVVTATPALVRKEQLPTANSMVSTVQSAGQLGGPALGGALVQVLGGTTALLADAASYLASAWLIGAARGIVRRTQTAAPRATLWRETVAGMAFVRRDWLLRRMMFGTATLNLGGSGLGALFVVYAYQRLHLTPLEFGITLNAFGVGALAGAFAYPRLARRHASGVLCLWGSAGSAAALFLIPLADVGLPLLVLVCYELAFASAVTIWGIANVTIRQLRSPAHMLGRVNALHRSVSLATVPLGAGLAAASAGTAGLIPTLLILCAASAITPFWYLSLPRTEIEQVADPP